MIRENMRLMVRENPGSEYKYVIADIFPYTAFRTAKGFRDFLRRGNLKLEYQMTGEHPVFGTIKNYKVVGTIEELSFWHKNEIPEGAERFTGLSNGSLVDCYYLPMPDGCKIYRPNPNAKEVYRPLPREKHLAHQKING